MITVKEIMQNEDTNSFCGIAYFILSCHEINNLEKEAVLNSFSLLSQQLIEACIYNDLESLSTFYQVIIFGLFGEACI